MYRYTCYTKYKVKNIKSPLSETCSSPSFFIAIDLIDLRTMPCYTVCVIANQVVADGGKPVGGGGGVGGPPPPVLGDITISKSTRNPLNCTQYKNL